MTSHTATNKVGDAVIPPTVLQFFCVALTPIFAAGLTSALLYWRGRGETLPLLLAGFSAPVCAWWCATVGGRYFASRPVHRFFWKASLLLFLIFDYAIAYLIAFIIALND